MSVRFAGWARESHASALSMATAWRLASSTASVLRESTVASAVPYVAGAPAMPPMSTGKLPSDACAERSPAAAAAITLVSRSAPARYASARAAENWMRARVAEPAAGAPWMRLHSAGCPSQAVVPASAASGTA